MLIFGEVHTGLLQNSTSLTQSTCERVLALFEGEQVRRSERPVAYAVSPDLVTGVDCRLPALSGARVRAIGTVAYRAMITGGHVVQGSAFARLERGDGDRRLPWSHYLSRPGRMETIGRTGWQDLARGFIGARAGTATLDLGAISGRAIDAVQSWPELDRTPPFRTARTRLRWVADCSDAEMTVDFGVEDGTFRTLQVSCAAERAGSIAELCEDLARHDWLLSTLLSMIERSRLELGSRAALRRLRPAIDHLLHLWMPGARLSPSLLVIWEGLERNPGFTRQWQVSVDRIRDQLALNTIALLGRGFD